MKTIAHIVCPYASPSGSLSLRAQEMTLQSLGVAANFSAPYVSVCTFSAQFEEDRDIVPPTFLKTRDLTRSMLNIGHPDLPTRKLPLIVDILDRLYEASAAYEYMAYSNIDISVLPHFYWYISRKLKEGVQSLAINRRSLPISNKTKSTLSCYSQLGEEHPGWDMFLFKRTLYPSFYLADLCLGAAGIGRGLLANLLALSPKHEEIKDAHLSFHIGTQKAWEAPHSFPYVSHNIEQCEKVLLHFLRKEPNNRSAVYWHLGRLQGWKRKALDSPQKAVQSPDSQPGPPPRSV